MFLNIIKKIACKFENIIQFSRISTKFAYKNFFDINFFRQNFYKSVKFIIMV